MYRIAVVGVVFLIVVGNRPEAVPRCAYKQTYHAERDSRHSILIPTGTSLSARLQLIVLSIRHPPEWLPRSGYVQRDRRATALSWRFPAGWTSAR